MKAIEFIVEYSKKQVQNLEDLIQNRIEKNPDPSLP